MRAEAAREPTRRCIAQVRETVRRLGAQVFIVAAWEAETLAREHLQRVSAQDACSGVRQS
jgi:hypothetical protein